MRIVHALAIASTIFGYCGNGSEAPTLPEQAAVVASETKPEDAHTVYVFTDFECPFCKKLDVELRGLAMRHPEAKVVLRHHPLPSHPNARVAARAAIAAEEQGKLDAYAEILFAHQGALDRASLDRYASDLGLDVARFDRDVDDTKTEARIVADEKIAKEVGIRGTPTSLVGVHVVEGALPIAEIERHLQ